MLNETFLVASRKGLFVMGCNDQQAPTIAAHYFIGDSVNQVLCDSRNGFWYAAQNLGHFGVKLKRSKNCGQTWDDLIAPSFGPKPINGPWANDETPWNVELIWTLVEGAANNPHELWAGCMPAGLFRSLDGGQSWQLCESLWLDERRKAWMGGGNDYPGIHSVCVDPRDPSHVTIAISCGGVWTSFDSGLTWLLIGHGQPADYLPPDVAADPNQQDPHRIAVCKAAPDIIWMQNHCGVLRSIDGGANFQLLGQDAKFRFGFAVAADSTNPNRAWYVPAKADTHRFSVDAALCVMRTDDGGQTFTRFDQGLPQTDNFELVYRHCLEVSADGQDLIMGSTTGHIWIGQNAGETWVQASASLPPIYAVAWVTH